MALFSGGHEALIGVDVGSSSVKVAEMRKGRSGYRLHAAAVVPLPPGAIAENTIHERQIVVDAIRLAVSQAGVSTRRAAIAVSGNAVIVKTILMPEMNELDMESQIAFEAEQYVPYDLEDLFMDFQVLGPSRKDPEQLEVVLVACKRSVVEEYQAMLAEAGLDLVCVDCAVFTLQNIAELLGEFPAEDVYHAEWKKGDAQTVAVVNIGASLIHMTILVRGRLTFVRDYFFGGNHLTEAIRTHYGIGYEQAEQMKIERLQEVDPAIIDRYLGDLASELMRSLEFYSAYHSNFPVERMLLCGGASLMPRIAQELHDRMGIEMDILQPFPKISFQRRKGLDAAAMQKMGPRMVIPLGLAIRAFVP